MRKGFIITLINNFSIFFTITGIVATIYLSIFFIPDYLVQIEEEKINNMTEAFISDLSKNIAGGNEIDLDALNAMIKGKEIKAGIDYPYTMRELLVQTQESIFTNELIPGALKEQMNGEVQKLMTKLSETTSFQDTDNKDEGSFANILRSNRSKVYGIAGLGILLSLLGIYSIYYQYHLNKRIYLKTLFEENKAALEQQIRVNLNFELVVSNALKSMKLKYNAYIDKQNKADLNLKTESGKTIYIKSRHWQTGEQIDVLFIEKFIQLVLSSKANGIFILNTENKQVLSMFEEHNKTHVKHKIYMLVGDTVEELKAMLVNSMNRIDKDK
jgi:cell division protein FtsB